MRRTNIELLRVICMFMVCILHVLGWGGVLDSCELGSLEYILCHLLEALCIVAVNVFVLISGYFSVACEYRLSRLVKFAVQILMYSILSIILVATVFKRSVSIVDLFKGIFPLTTGQYWFASAFIVAMICSPIINMAIHRISKIQMKMAVGILVMLFSLFPTMIPWSRTLLTGGYDFSWFIILYVVAAYIRLYNVSISRPFVLYFGLSTVLLLSRVVIEIATKRVMGSSLGEDTLFAYSSIFVLLSSVALFLGFLQMKEGKLSRFIAPAGKLVFGAYLISDHNLIRQHLWKTLNVSRYHQGNTSMLLVSIIVVAFVIVCVGSTVEFVRTWLMKKSHLNDAIERIDKTKMNAAINEKLLLVRDESL